MINNTINFNRSEEAFVQSSLNEVVKIWATGSGQASFRLDVSDGLATLQLSFQLGKPTDVHCDLGVGPQPAGHVHAYRHQHHHRRKGPARREKDRARAAAHQARLLQSEGRSNPTLADAAPTVSDSKTDTSENIATAPAAIMLPFSGKLLPLEKMQPVTRTSSVASEAKSLESPTPTYSAVVTAVPIKGNRRGAFYVDVNSAKKKLFPPDHDRSQPFSPIIPPPEPTPARTPATPSNKTKSNSVGFKKKENELFLKLFS